MQSFCAANRLTISIAKTEVVIFGEGYLLRTWKVAGQNLKRSQSFTYLGMLFHEDQHIKHPIHARYVYGKACASVGAIYFRYSRLECANSVQHSFLRRACRVKKSVPVDIIFQELAVTR